MDKQSTKIEHHWWCLPSGGVRCSKVNKEGAYAKRAARRPAFKLIVGYNRLKRIRSSMNQCRARFAPCSGSNVRQEESVGWHPWDDQQRSVYALAACQCAGKNIGYIIKYRDI